VGVSESRSGRPKGVFRKALSCVCEFRLSDQPLPSPAPPPDQCPRPACDGETEIRGDDTAHTEDGLSLALAHLRLIKAQRTGSKQKMQK
jgi:hypothetical protein